MTIPIIISLLILPFFLAGVKEIFSSDSKEGSGCLPVLVFIILVVICIALWNAWFIIRASNLLVIRHCRTQSEHWRINFYIGLFIRYMPIARMLSIYRIGLYAFLEGLTNWASAYYSAITFCMDINLLRPTYMTEYHSSVSMSLTDIFRPGFRNR